MLFRSATFFPFVWRSARRLGAPEGTLDDVAQEVFVIVHRRLAQFEARSSLKTWLFGIVVNVVRAQRRRRPKTSPDAASSSRAVPETLPDTGPGPHETLARAEAARVVDCLLEALDDDKRAVFVLAELEEMPAPEIAAALGIPLNTVYSRLRLARQEFAIAGARHRAREARRAP